MVNKELISNEHIFELVEGAHQLKDIFDEVKGYNELIVNDSAGSLLDEKLAFNAWEMFAQGLQEFPDTMPVGRRRFSDYPEIMREVLHDGFGGFQAWFKEEVQDDEAMERICDQAILRNVFHFFEYAVRLGEEIPVDALESMRREFDDLDFAAKTSWLSRFFNGLQTSVMEVYVVDRYLDHSLEGNEQQ